MSRRIRWHGSPADRLESSFECEDLDLECAGHQRWASARGRRWAKVSGRDIQPASVGIDREGVGALGYRNIRYHGGRRSAVHRDDDQCSRQCAGYIDELANRIEDDGVRV